MKNAHDLIARAADPGSSPSLQPDPPLASWYTPGISDGLGDRLLMFDNTSSASLELLRFRPDLASAPGFEHALRDRVAELVEFEHPSFSRVRTVERLDEDNALALVSVHTPGKRLSELFDGPRRGAVHPEFAAWLVRELTPALADFHELADGIAHGALAPDRIVLTPDGRLVIVEHVLASALASVKLPPQFWHDIGVLPMNGPTPPNGRQDVAQLGLVALSFALGRRLTADEYPQKLPLLLDEFTHAAARRSSRAGMQLRPWLERALNPRDARFGSSEALDAALRDLPEPVRRHSPGSSDLAHARSLVPTSEAPMKNTAAEPSVELLRLDLPPDLEAAALPEPVVLEFPPVDPSTDEGRNPIEDQLPPIPVRRTGSSTRTLAVAFGVVALVEAAAIAWLMTDRPATTAAAPAPVLFTIESAAPGNAVVVDGREAGVTPLALNLDGPFHAIRVLGGKDTIAAPVSAAATRGVGGAANTPARSSADGESRAIAAAAARQRSGGVRLTSPIELHVFEGERILGSSADGPIVASAGVHQFDLVNNALGYRTRQTVEIKAGQIASLKVQPPDGRVSINASPWAQVWIDGNLIGETPLANVSVPIGQHEVTFRHPQLGERRVTAIVKAGAPTRVSATFGQ